MSRAISISSAVLICIVVLAPTGMAQEPEDSALRVMSFNIRFGTARDGDNHWDKRKQIVAQVIRESNPDLIGTQETLEFQAEYLAEQLPDYSYVGRSRQVDPKQGEQCGIFYRSQRFAKLAEGHFWLSETPGRPGSKSWDSSLPRMVTWIQLWDRTSKNSLYVINTHFDHRGQQARLESAKLLRTFATRLPHHPRHIVVTGDFNSRQSSPPYQALFTRETDQEDQTALLDTYRVKHPVTTDSESTSSGFRGLTQGRRIDWIACSTGFQVLNADIVRTAYSGKYPSDHYPVTAQLEFSQANGD